MSVFDVTGEISYFYSNPTQKLPANTEFKEDPIVTYLFLMQLLIPLLNMFFHNSVYQGSI